jgi:hypothetical protein
MQGMAQRFADTLQTIEVTRCRLDVRRIRPLLSPFLQQAALAEAFEQGLQQALFEPPARSRARHSLRTEKANPGRYFPSIQLRTASAACRSKRFSANGPHSTWIPREREFANSILCLGPTYKTR